MANIIEPIKNQHQSVILLNKEIRHIEASSLTKLSAIIDKAKAWAKLLDELTRPSQIEGNEKLVTLNLSLEAINLIEQQFYCGRSPTQALLNHWAITGRRRPTIRSLLGYLRICNLKWAEDYVIQEILGIKSIALNQAPSQKQTTTITYEINDEFEFKGLEKLIEGLETECTKYSFTSIYKSTNKFCHQSYTSNTKFKTKIGEGRFSSVYRAQTHPLDTESEDKLEIVAAKLLKSSCNERYLANEINLMKKIEHENILQLLGISLGKSPSDSFSYICLIYPYMENGSLLDCLSFGLPTRKNEYMVWHERIEIAIKIARGISYLHSLLSGPIIHRDIKTANIFIDENLEPKVGDFTLVRQLDTIRAAETQFSQNVIGTSVYMPPEAFRGDISIKFDTFSFGIVLIELLSGMKPFNEELGEDLFTYVNERLFDIHDELVGDRAMTDDQDPNLNAARDIFLEEILDKKAGEWNFNSSKVLFDIALQAIESRKKNRPELSSLLPNLEAIMP